MRSSKTLWVCGDWAKGAIDLPLYRWTILDGDDVPVADAVNGTHATYNDVSDILPAQTKPTALHSRVSARPMSKELLYDLCRNGFDYNVTENVTVVGENLLIIKSAANISGTV